MRDIRDLPTQSCEAPAMAADPFGEFDTMLIDRELVRQDDLDIANRCRTSLFPWRGQFSPQLVELMLDLFATEGPVVDPFVGSGTTLFECARKGLECYGADINPAAITMARTAEFANLRPSERTAVIASARRVAKESLPDECYRGGLFDALEAPTAHDISQAIATMLHSVAADRHVQTLLANAAMRFMAERNSTTGAFIAGLKAHARLVEQLPCSPHPCKAELCDARTIPMPDASVRFVLTSPPYINVFNYHQNHRPAMELMGWRMLEVAKSEFGSNRKNRGNRFRTVIQYSLDMSLSLAEMHRILRPDGRLVLVVGRESNVRGVAFRNGRLLAALAQGAGLRLDLRQERRFTNRFGESIREDILHFSRVSPPPQSGLALARQVAQQALAEALATAPSGVRRELEEAIASSQTIPPSPVFAPDRATRREDACHPAPR